MAKRTISSRYERLGHKAGSNSNGNSWNCWIHLRSGLTIILMILILITTSISVFLQLRQVDRCTVDHSSLPEMNSPNTIVVPTTRHQSNLKQSEIPNNNNNPKRRQDIDTKTIQQKKKGTVMRQRKESISETLPSPAQATGNTTTSKPILVWTSMAGFNRMEPCDVPCQYTTAFNLQKDVDACVYERRGYSPPHDHCNFSIYLQMEGEHYYPIKLDRYHLENSYNWRSPLLKPYFEWIHFHGENNIQNPPVKWSEAINGATFIARNCHSKNKREEVIKDLLAAGVRVDALSNCLHNADPPQRNNKIQMMQPYKFNLAFENGNVEDYVTEKVYQALASGVVPVYMGAPNIDMFVPDNSIIDSSKFNSTQALAEHLKECMQNETLYNSYQEWRTKPLPDWFLQRFNFTHVTTECRTCRYIHAMRNGWEWDKENQQGIAPTIM